MIRSTAIAALAAFALATGAHGQDKQTQEPKEDIKPMTIGDSARPIDIAHWIKGDKVTKFEPGKIYVLEFWATWCGPCREGMPHLTKLQKDYKDYRVTIVGVSDEELTTVEEFLAKKDKEGTLWNDKIGYTLATDPDKSVYRDYFKAADQNGIPTAFIIGKDQKIEWIGHPGSMDKALDAVVKDSWDRNAFKTQWEKQQAGERELNQFFTLLAKENKPEEAYNLGRKLLDTYSNDAMTLNQIAWFVVDNKNVQTRDLEFAMEVAAKANDLTEGKDPAILDTQARVYYEQGDLKNAIRLQKKAVEFAKDGPMAQSIADTLKKYEDEWTKKTTSGH